MMEIFSLNTVFLVVVGAVTLGYLHCRRKLGYWKRRGVANAVLPFIFQNFTIYFTKPAHEVVLQMYKKYGRVHGAYEGLEPTIVVADPALLKLIFVQDFPIFINRRHFITGHKIMDKMVQLLRDDEWKRVRTVISPTFTSGRMRKMVHLVNESADLLLENLLKAASSGSAVECKTSYGNFTMDTISRCAFGLKMNSQEDGQNPFLTHAKELLSTNFSMLMLFFFPTLARLLGLTFFPQKATDFFCKISEHTLHLRKEKKEKGNDFLQLVVDAQEGYKEEEQEVDSDYNVGATVAEKHTHPQKYKTLTNDEAVAQCFLFFLVGYETTASTLGFVSYALAINPDCQEKLIKEIDDVWEKNMGNIDFDIVSKMPYLDAVICETLRLYTITVRAERVPSEDYVLGNTGITIPKGMSIDIPLYAIHHDPEFYPEPEKFDPERFSPENRKLRDPFTFLPFGAGPRNCIGMRFALMEIKLCLVRVLRHVRFVKSPETKVPLEFPPGQFLLTPKSLKLAIKKRNTWQITKSFGPENG